MTLIDAEVLQALRRWNVSGGLPSPLADDLLRLYDELGIRRYPHRELLARVWELRFRLTACDALYVALAEGLGMPLLTADGRLARTAGHQATIQLL